MIVTFTTAKENWKTKVRQIIVAKKNYYFSRPAEKILCEARKLFLSEVKIRFALRAIKCTKRNQFWLLLTDLTDLQMSSHTKKVFAACTKTFLQTFHDICKKILFAARIKHFLRDATTFLGENMKLILSNCHFVCC